jgi:hypothetical protein
MSGFYDDASWVLIPEGIKEDVVYAQKPTNGLGDLTFTRASDATRTNSAGVIERTPWNLVTASEMFTDATWGKNAIGLNTAIGTSGIQANVATAPNGTLTADRVNFNLQNDLDVGLAQTYAAALAGQTFTTSFYAKGEGAQIGKQVSVRFKRSTGGSFLASELTITLTSEWVRYTLNPLTLVTSNTGTQLIFSAPTTTGATSALIWGVQLVEGTDAKPYFATTNRQDVPRLHYRNADGSVSTCPRLLLEPQRTNGIRNSTMVGAVAGSPGTVPTNWERTSGGLTQTIVGIGTENGLQYIDFNFAGTASGTLTLFYETLAQIVASNGQTWSNSFYAKLISGTADSFVLVIRELSSGGGNLGTGTQTFSPSSNLQRFTFTRTNANALTAFIRPGLFVNLTTGATYAFTIRIAAPQMELGAYATTFIPTTTAAVTRLADAASKTGVSSLIGQTEGTMFLELNIPELINAGGEFSLSNGTDIISIQRPSASNNRIRCVVFVGGSFPVTIDRTITTGGTFKVAFAYKQNDFAMYVDGVQVGTDNSGNVPTLNRIIFAPPFIAGQAALFPTRLTNAQLAQLTT